MTTKKTNPKTDIQVDWLQLNCSGIPYQISLFDFELQPYGTRIFKTVINVSKKNKPVCSMAFNPHSNILKQDTVIVKFDNKFLYQNNLFVNVDEVIKYLQLKIKGITRIDLAVDFNVFDNGLKPQRLIKNFMASKYLKMGAAQYKLIGSQKLNHNYEYLRFGNNISNVSAYLYNKSKEMQDVVMKQHIFDNWLLNEIDVTKTVWRLEFSFKGNQLKILEQSTGSIEDVRYHSLFNSIILKRLFYSAVNKYFHFKINNGNKNKSLMSSLKLFNDLDYNSTIIKLSDKIDSNRADKIFIKKMEMYNNEIRQINLTKAFDFDNIITDFVSSRRMQGTHATILRKLN